MSCSLVSNASGCRWKNSRRSTSHGSWIPGIPSSSSRAVSRVMRASIHKSPWSRCDSSTPACRCGGYSTPGASRTRTLTRCLSVSWRALAATARRYFLPLPVPSNAASPTTPAARHFSRRCDRQAAPLHADACVHTARAQHAGHPTRWTGAARPFLFRCTRFRLVGAKQKTWHPAVRLGDGSFSAPAPCGGWLSSRFNLDRHRGSQPAGFKKFSATPWSKSYLQSCASAQAEMSVSAQALTRSRNGPTVGEGRLADCRGDRARRGRVE
jgi:hypothetical protein